MAFETELLERVVAGDPGAWQALLVEASPVIDRRVRHSEKMRNRFERLHERDNDSVCDVRCLVFSRLEKASFSNIQRFLDGARTRPMANFQAWLLGTTDFAIQEYMSQRYGRSRASSRRDRGPRPHKRDVGSFADELDEDDELSVLITASSMLTGRSLLQYARVNFAAKEYACLSLYLIGHSYGEIDEMEDCGGPQLAEDMIRRLKQRLRVAFGEGGPTARKEAAQTCSA